MYSCVAEVGKILEAVIIMLTVGLILSFNQSQNINLDRTITVPNSQLTNSYFSTQVNVFRRLVKT